MLRGFERDGFASVERVSEALESAANGDATQAPLEARGAVQALSIHAAKGLEFDHVFLVDCGGRGKQDTRIPRVVESEDGVWNIALVTKGSAWQATDGGRAESEERRCLYVAMTRARVSLTLSWKTRITNAGKPHGSDRPQYLPAEFATLASLTMLRDATFFVWAGHEIDVLPPAGSPTEEPPAPESG